MSILLDNESRVCLVTETSLLAPSISVTFTWGSIPQLRRVLELLEKDKPAS